MLPIAVKNGFDIKHTRKSIFGRYNFGLIRSFSCLLVLAATTRTEEFVMDVVLHFILSPLGQGVKMGNIGPFAWLFIGW